MPATKKLESIAAAPRPSLNIHRRRRWRLFGPRRRVQARCRIRTPSIVGSSNAASGFERSGSHYDERRTVGVGSAQSRATQDVTFRVDQVLRRHRRAGRVRPPFLSSGKRRTGCTTVTLSIGTVKMARKKVIVKHLAAIQSCVCSDNTGRLPSAFAICAGT